MQNEQEGPVDVGNKICPVSGEEIYEEMKATYEHEGKIYNFCCAMCIDEFKKDPEKYIEKIEEEKGNVTLEEIDEAEFDSEM
ncbi:MAG: YHS domain-containing protein [Candidatus Omnitrophica bacterium]|nr:YHS domain-containing protein [Candidatus Omnitrophota bacterium]MBU4590817.1 YHS domain-containing protein [Candidatus Omnitrophota bacterium]